MTNFATQKDFREMINRTLIRLKVVQTLYSYMLTRTDFRLQQRSSRDTRDTNAAYDLYIDLLLFVIELTGRSVRRENPRPLSGIAMMKPISDSKLIASLAGCDEIKQIIAEGKNDVGMFDTALIPVYESITSSAIWRDFLKKRKSGQSDEIEFWSVVTSTIIAKSPEVLAAARQTPTFTAIGFENALKMVVETLRSYADAISSPLNAHRTLEAGLSKSYELYHSLFMLMVELTEERERQLESAKEKFIPTDDDLNPNLRFVENKFIAALRSNEALAQYRKDNPMVAWSDDLYLMKTLLDEILSSEIYENYMNGPEPDFSADCELWRNILRNIILPSDAFAESMEMRNVFWNDDLDIMSTFVTKTIRQWSSAGNDSPGIMPMYKDDEDSRFGDTLLDLAIKNREEYATYINRFIDAKQWDSERLPFMDIVILTAMMAELIHFPLIPIAVTVNEYVEIGNRYSTPKSGAFINGVIGNIIALLREEGKLTK